MSQHLSQHRSQQRSQHLSQHLSQHRSHILSHIRSHMRSQHRSKQHQLSKKSDHVSAQEVGLDLLSEAARTDRFHGLWLWYLNSLALKSASISVAESPWLSWSVGEWTLKFPSLDMGGCGWGCLLVASLCSSIVGWSGLASGEVKDGGLDIAVSSLLPGFLDLASPDKAPRRCAAESNIPRPRTGVQM